MPTLTVRTPDTVVRLEVAEGVSVRDLLDATELRVRAACGGTGTCGACEIRLLGGDTNGLTTAEFMKLTPGDRAKGRRLACQLRLRGDAEVLVEHPAPRSAWKSIPHDDLPAVTGARPELGEDIYGVAVDLGTTHIRVSLWDRRAGRRIASRRGPNPQAAFGADVLNRLDAARARPERAAELARLARTAVIEAVRDMAARDMGEVSPLLAEIGRVVVVGNTAMLALLTGRGGEALLAPENWERPVDCTPADLAAWRAEWFMPHAEILVAPPLAGFIGSDLTADFLATGLAAGPPGSLLLDLGTNTEIALWDGRRMLVTSVPGGPAFEGGVSRGMPAEPGAICRVEQRGSGFACEVIGGIEARGFCGSGLLDAVAGLLAAGRLKPSGRFAEPPGESGFLLLPDNPHTSIMGSDVDALQRGKAAVAAAMAVLLSRARMGWSDLRRICVCGAFGRTLDVDNARAVGLLPPAGAEVPELYGDAALGGCEAALLAVDPAAVLRAAAGELIAVNMSLVREYDDIFVEQLRLRPIPTA